MTFQIHALPWDQFSELFSLTDEELAARNARRETVTSNPGFPCRVSLEDADVGEEVILVHYEHQPGRSPYKASHAVFIRKNARQALPDVGEVPALFRHRLMSVRAFDRKHDMIDADVVEGTGLEGVINRMFEDSAVDYIHLHNAKPGCYAAKVTRS